MEPLLLQKLYTPTGKLFLCLFPHCLDNLWSVNIRKRLSLSPDKDNLRSFLPTRTTPLQALSIRNQHPGYFPLDYQHDHIPITGVWRKVCKTMCHWKNVLPSLKHDFIIVKTKVEVLNTELSFFLHRIAHRALWAGWKSSRIVLSGRILNADSLENLYRCAGGNIFQDELFENMGFW